MAEEDQLHPNNSNDLLFYPDYSYSALKESKVRKIKNHVFGSLDQRSPVSGSERAVHLGSGLMSEYIVFRLRQHTITLNYQHSTIQKEQLLLLLLYFASSLTISLVPIESKTCAS